MASPKTEAGRGVCGGGGEGGPRAARQTVQEKIQIEDTLSERPTRYVADGCGTLTGLFNPSITESLLVAVTGGSLPTTTFLSNVSSNYLSF